jgi:hypothetical protein
VSIKETEDYSYIEELTFKELVEFITDMEGSSVYLKHTFDYEKHTQELILRCKRGTMVSRIQVIKAFNNLDRSEDFISVNADELYTVNLEEFLKELDL